MIHPKHRPNQTCDYWLITPIKRKALHIQTNIVQQRAVQTSERAVIKHWAITINRLINSLIQNLLVKLRGILT